MATYLRRLTDEEAAKNLAENRMLTQLPHEDWCSLRYPEDEESEWWALSIECTCITADVVAKLREMGLMT